METGADFVFEKLSAFFAIPNSSFSKFLLTEIQYMLNYVNDFHKANKTLAETQWNITLENLYHMLIAFAILTKNAGLRCQSN